MSEVIHDVVIIGGGFSGLGAALKLTAYDIKPLVLEAENLCSQTSGQSHRIVHGGFRYLQTLSLKRVYQSAYAQAEFLSLYSQYLSIMPCMLPLKKIGVRSALPLSAALWFYHALQQAIPLKSPGKGKLLSYEEVASIAQDFASICRHGAFSWMDVRVTDVVSLADAIAADVSSGGGIIQEGAEVVSVTRDASLYRVHYLEAGEEKSCTTRVLVNTMGPWVSHHIEGLPEVFSDVFWCKGYNLLLKKSYHDTYGLSWQGTHGANYFLVPREIGSALGTCYTPVEALSYPLSLSEDEIGSFVQDANESFPSLAISFSDVQGFEAGYLPVASMASDGSPRLLSTSKLFVEDSYIALLSTKFTTCFREGEKIAKKVFSLLQ